MRIIYRFISITFIFILFCTSAGFAATQICDEDFERVDSGILTEINPTENGEISRAARPFWGTALSAPHGGVYDSIGNPGKAAKAHVGPYTNNSSYSEPKFRFDNKLGGTRQVYFKFDLRIDPNLGTSNASREISNFKLFLVTDHSDASAAVFSDGIGRVQVNFEPSDSSYSVYSPGAGDPSGDSSEYYFSNATTKLANRMMDNQWHTYEIFIDIGTHVSSFQSNNRLDGDPNNDGVIRIWEDGVLILDDTKVPIRFSQGYFTEINSAAFIRHAKSLGAPVGGMDGYIYFDNIEIWDGMPTQAGGGGGSTDLVAPGVVQNLNSTPGYRLVQFNWRNPSDSDFAGTIIRYNTDGAYPFDQNDGTIACNQPGIAGSIQNFTLTDLQPGLTYHFSVFSYDTSGNYSNAAHTSAILGPRGLEVIHSSSN